MSNNNLQEQKDSKKLTIVKHFFYMASKQDPESDDCKLCKKSILILLGAKDCIVPGEYAPINALDDAILNYNLENDNVKIDENSEGIVVIHSNSEELVTLHSSSDGLLVEKQHRNMKYASIKEYNAFDVDGN
ncbi:MAG TPA: hypothetical protein DCP90_04865 [Clostridiales bacterium]|nr:MAG: hypothetical protein A2Y22_06400 [Clostridiales bacterium GWD2_32_59]HAN09929.1 hypothetical protein [Clostridiales bacterium]